MKKRYKKNKQFEPVDQTEQIRSILHFVMFLEVLNLCKSAYNFASLDMHDLGDLSRLINDDG